MDDAEAAKAAEYKQEYDKASAALDEAEKSTTPRGADGKFIKVEEAPAAPVVEPPPEKPAEEDRFTKLQAEVERLAKVAQDNQAWGTRASQELAEFKRQKEIAEREATRPKLLDAHPDLEQVVRYVQSDPRPAQEAQRVQSQWDTSVRGVHADVFADDFPATQPELYQSIIQLRDRLGQQWLDPVVANREITQEKLAFERRQAERRLAAEVAKQTQKSAMSVPGAGGTSIGGQVDEAARIRNMSNAQFNAEKRRVMGY